MDWISASGLASVLVVGLVIIVLGAVMACVISGKPTPKPPKRTKGDNR